MIWNEIAEAIKLWWAVIAALVGIFGVIVKWVVIPIRNFSKVPETIKEMSEKLDKIEKKVEENCDATSTLQHDRLIQAYEHFMEKGWIPHHKKHSLVKMFDQYHNAGYNSIFDTYRQDILDLPERPPENKDKGDER